MLISIITPMYNAEYYISETIKSVQCQTCSAWELLVINDASTDRSPDIVKEFASQDSRIKLYTFNENRGIANARNFGIAKATGAWVCFLDSDDIWEPDKLDYQLKYMIEHNLNFTYTSCSIISNSGECLGRKRAVPDKVDYKTLLKGNVVLCSSVMYKQKMIKVWMPDVKHEDFAAWLDVLRSEDFLYGINKKLVKYRISDTSVSKNKLKALMWTWKIFYCYQKLSIGQSIYYFILFTIFTTKKYLLEKKE